MKIKIGIIGCGNICDIYFQNLKKFANTEVAACADLVLERAQAKAAQYKIAKACTVKELLADPEIKIILNLTIPKAHAEIAFKAVAAGKSVYNEKPLTIDLADAKKLLALAKKKKVLVGCAPDTFMGAGLQTCRRLMDKGIIGKPVAATAFMMCHGHESWHPAPEFYYKRGGGPMLDMGPYYVTALVSLLGPVARVTSSSQIMFPTRTITSKPQYGKKIRVEVPTHAAGIMDFKQGAVATIITSFDVWPTQLPRIEIYGTKGTLRVPDPNTFDGPVTLITPDRKEKKIGLTHAYAANSRGLGVSDMARALVSGGKHRANGEMACHVLEVMHAFHAASAKGRRLRGWTSLSRFCSRRS